MVCLGDSYVKTDTDGNTRISSREELFNAFQCFSWFLCCHLPISDLLAMVPWQVGLQLSRNKSFPGTQQLKEMCNELLREMLKSDMVQVLHNASNNDVPLDTGSDAAFPCES